jgi:hypothetical protein
MVKRTTRQRCRRIELSCQVRTIRHRPEQDAARGSTQLQRTRTFRAIGVPAYLLGIGISGYNYSNATQAKQDLYLLGAKLYLDAIQETLSGPDILPRNRFVEFDTEDLIADVEMNHTEISVEEPASSRTPQDMNS